jgi:hypothetical protein
MFEGVSHNTAKKIETTKTIYTSGNRSSEKTVIEKISLLSKEVQSLSSLSSPLFAL